MTREPNFLESVSRNFDKAAGLTDLPKGLLAQIKACNSVYQMRFPVKLDNGSIEVIEAYQYELHENPEGASKEAGIEIETSTAES
mgnify:CR=1 FL=1